ncbi:MAG: 3-hydroxybutyrate dehydrogenase, partial [Pseudomonadota bacterium]
MQKNLEGKTALVTGSTSGIGAGIAKKLAAAGANIAVTGLEDDQNITQQLIDTYNIKAYFFQADLSKSQPCAELVQNAANKMNSVDILVNNAGAQYVSPVEDFADEKWDLLIALNLSASFHLIKSSLPYMRKGDYGRIINIASAHGLVASPQKAAYVAAKHGLVGLTKVVGLETAQENITVNAICPGWVLTPLVQKQIDAIAANHNI